MEIATATAEDNQELIDLQARCPQGRGLVTSLINTPDFFVRAAAWSRHAIFKATHQGRIIASASCGAVQANINQEPAMVGYQFEAFVDPAQRRRGAARALLERMDQYHRENQASMAYAMVMQGNRYSLGLVAAQGFVVHRDITMNVILVHRKMEERNPEAIRPAGSDDLADLAELQNRTWQGFDFHQPMSPEGLAAFLERTPGHSLEQEQVLQTEHGPAACAGVWDWGSITKVRVVSTTWPMKLKGLLLDMLKWLRPVPRMAKPGQELKQWCLTSLGFKSPEDLAALLARINNLALAQGVDTVFLMAQDAPWVAEALGEFISIPVTMHLVVKGYGDGPGPGEAPVHLDGIHL